MRSALSIALLTVFAAAAQPSILFRDDFSKLGTVPDRTLWTTETGPSSFLGRTQLADWITPGGVGQFVVGPEGAELALQTYNPTGFSLYGTHAKTLQSFFPGPGGVIEFKTRLRLDSSSLRRPGIVYAMYLYACDPGNCAAQHDEIDIELLTNQLQPGRPLRVQLNRYADEPLGPGHGRLVDLPFDFDPLAPHDWVIRWSLSRIDYLVDGILLASETTFVPQAPMQVNVIAWAPGPEWAAAHDASLQPVGSAAENESFKAWVRLVEVAQIPEPQPLALVLSASALALKKRRRPAQGAGRCEPEN